MKYPSILQAEVELSDLPGPMKESFMQQVEAFEKEKYETQEMLNKVFEKLVVLDKKN